MEDTGSTTAAGTSVRAVLEGGPSSIPIASRVQIVGLQDEKIKLQHCGGYEHFERTSELNTSAAHQDAVFRWTTRTEMAE
jgi:hypothetical protein